MSLNAKIFFNSIEVIKRSLIKNVESQLDKIDLNNKRLIEFSSEFNKIEEKLNKYLDLLIKYKILLSKAFEKVSKQKSVTISEKQLNQERLTLFDRIKSDSERIIKLHETLVGHSVNVPILMYHNIVNGKSKERYSISLEMFKKQMNWLKENNYQPINADQLNKYLKNEVLFKKPIILTFDDALENLNLIKEIMLKHNFKGIISVVTNTIKKNEVFTNRFNKKKTLTLKELKQFEKSGWDIVSHSHDLHHLGKNDLKFLKRTETKEYFLKKIELDLKSSNVWLQKHFPNQKNNVLVWPFGFFEDAVIDIANKVGFDVFLTTKNHNLNSIKSLIKKRQSPKHLFSSLVHRFVDPKYITRIEISNNVDLDEFKKRILNEHYMLILKLKNKFKPYLKKISLNF